MALGRPANLLFRSTTHAVALIGLCSCLVTSSSDFPSPPRTPPFLNSFTASPKTDELLVVERPTTSPVTFSAQVRSEDEGAQIEAKLVADLATDSPVLLDFVRVPPGTFSDPRDISMTWNPGTVTGDRVVEPGCHTFTMIVSHSYQLGTFVPTDSGDADQLVWWVLLGDPDDPEFLSTATLAGCPSRTPPAEVQEAE